MSRIIITVKRSEDASERDVEVPADIPVATLSELIARALRWPVSSPGQTVEYGIECRKAGAEPCRLNSGESLAQAGIWDGVRLIFHPAVTARVAAAKLQTPESANLAVVTVKKFGFSQVRDVTVPLDQPARLVAETVASGFEWGRDADGAAVQFRIEVVQKEPPGFIVEPDRTLAEVGVRNGCWLIFHPSVETTAQSAEQKKAPPSAKAEAAAEAVQTSQGDATPVKGWRSLGIELPDEDAGAAPDPVKKPQTEGFQWKKLE